MTVRMLIADDQMLVRAGFRSLLERDPELRVVAEAEDGLEAVRLARTEKPDVALLDIRMPGIDGLEATRRITGDPALSGVRVVILTTYEMDDYIFEALRSGASGFLAKTVDPAELRRAVHIVAAGEALLTPSVTRTVIGEFARTPSGGRVDAERLAALTEREREVLTMIGAGLSNYEIAAKLHMSPLTAKTHVSRIFTKLDARDRAQLVVMAYETGLVSPGST